MYATIGSQSHEVNALTVLFRILIGCHNLRILQDASVGTGPVDFHQVLIYDAARPDIKVAHLGVTHLSVRQSHVFARSLQLRYGIVLRQIIHVRCRCVEDHIAFSMVTHSPSVENH